MSITYKYMSMFVMISQLFFFEHAGLDVSALKGE